MKCGFVAVLAAGLCALTAGPVSAQAAEQKATQRVLVVVDESVYPQIRTPLKQYMAHVEKLQPVEFEVLSEGFYAMKPPAIRERLAKAYRTSPTPVIGAIMVGPIPHAVRGKDARGSILTPAPMYYEDFDATWVDDDGDGYYDRVETDRVNNALEMWTAWWTPPSNEPREQVEMLKAYLAKLDRYYRGKIDGRDGMIFIAGNGNSVEITEAWTVLMNDAMASTGQRVVKVYSVDGEMDVAVHPTEGEYFKPADLERALEEGRYQHIHLLTHGSPTGFYWEQAAVTGTRLDFDRFDGSVANIVTTSGCSNGNFRGANNGPADYSRSIGNKLVFSPRTITVAYYGATSPQSTGVFAMCHTQMHEALDPQRGSYFGEGYLKLRNTDYAWGLQHYVYRGIDGKALIGDPFARYHQTQGEARRTASTDEPAKSCTE